MRLAGPVLMNQEQRMVIKCLVHVIIQASQVFAAWAYQRHQFLPNLTFLAWFGFYLYDDSE